MIENEHYSALAFYTLSLGDPAFIHQHIVDAFQAQTANEQSKAITVFFSLAGLYLHIEKEYTGRRVQLAHMHMARITKAYPKLPLPENRGSITVGDVVETPPGKQRDEMIHRWCISVWDAYSQQRETVIALTESLLTYFTA
jgi:hypothetical protein